MRSSQKTLLWLSTGALNLAFTGQIAFATGVRAPTPQETDLPAVPEGKCMVYKQGDFIGKYDYDGDGRFLADHRFKPFSARGEFTISPSAVSYSAAGDANQKPSGSELNEFDVSAGKFRGSVLKTSETSYEVTLSRGRYGDIIGTYYFAGADCRGLIKGIVVEEGSVKQRFVQDLLAIVSKSPEGAKLALQKLSAHDQQKQALTRELEIAKDAREEACPEGTLHETARVALSFLSHPGSWGYFSTEIFQKVGEDDVSYARSLGPRCYAAYLAEDKSAREFIDFNFPGMTHLASQSEAKEKPVTAPAANLPVGPVPVPQNPASLAEGSSPAAVRALAGSNSSLRAESTQVASTPHKQTSSLCPPEASFTAIPKTDIFTCSYEDLGLPSGVKAERLPENSQGRVGYSIQLTAKTAKYNCPKGLTPDREESGKISCYLSLPNVPHVNQLPLYSELNKNGTGYRLGIAFQSGPQVVEVDGGDSPQLSLQAGSAADHIDSQ